MLNKLVCFIVHHRFTLTLAATLASTLAAIEDPYGGQVIPPAEPETPVQPVKAEPAKQEHDPRPEMIAAARGRYIAERVARFAELSKATDLTDQSTKTQQAVKDAVRLKSKPEADQLAWLRKIAAGKDEGPEHPYATLTLKMHGLWLAFERSKPTLENVKAVAAKKLLIGMAVGEITLAAGLPDDSRKQTTADHVIEVWIYKTGRTLTLKDGVLFAIEE